MMIDIETLDTKPSSVVLSIGAVTFDSVGRTWDRFEAVLDVQPQLELGRTVSFNTITWWMDQSEDAKETAFGYVRESVALAILNLTTFCRQSQANRYWALGPQFDYVILESLYKDYSQITPWGYGQLRDVRTVCEEAKLDRKSLVSKVKGVPHTPLFDCEVQIENLLLARAILGAKNIT